jgi:NADP-dependent 3-hydroxy acid dehydrogenase YdfG
MLKRNKGHIVTLTSAYGLFSGVSQAQLSADTHSVVGLMESLRLDLKRTEVKTTTICSSGVKALKSKSAR